MNTAMLDIAKKLASNLTNNEYKIVAIITDRKGKILSTGVNSYSKTHPRQAYYAAKCGQYSKIYLHAEINALVNCSGKPHSIYVARINNFGKALYSKPCPICSMAIKDAGIKEIVHT